MFPKVYTETREVTEGDIDEMLHVNNVVYLQFLQDLAISHWYSVAPSPLVDSLRWVVKKHEIEYFYPARLGDPLLLKTWVSELTGVTSTRNYEIYTGQHLTIQAKTLWISVDPDTHKPKRIPPGIKELFFETT